VNHERRLVNAMDFLRAERAQQFDGLLSKKLAVPNGSRRALALKNLDARHSPMFVGRIVRR
jgi:hypothetical protein